MRTHCLTDSLLEYIILSWETLEIQEFFVKISSNFIEICFYFVHRRRTALIVYRISLIITNTTLRTATFITYLSFVFVKSQILRSPAIFLEGENFSHSVCFRRGITVTALSHEILNFLHITTCYNNIQSSSLLVSSIIVINTTTHITTTTSLLLLVTIALSLGFHQFFLKVRQFY